jgi:hypothetical protein
MTGIHKKTLNLVETDLIRSYSFVEAYVLAVQGTSASKNSQNYHKSQTLSSF